MKNVQAKNAPRQNPERVPEKKAGVDRTDPGGRTAAPSVSDGKCPIRNIPAALSTEGDCSPGSDAQFVGRLLAIVESAGDTLTFAEALNIARGLLRARLAPGVRS